MSGVHTDRCEMGDGMAGEVRAETVLQVVRAIQAEADVERAGGYVGTAAVLDRAAEIARRVGVPR